jgi:transcriptional regulator with XRE-family HTH domain
MALPGRWLIQVRHWWDVVSVKNFGDLVRRMRMERGLPQADAAQAAGMSAGNWHRQEKLERRMWRDKMTIAALVALDRAAPVDRPTAIEFCRLAGLDVGVAQKIEADRELATKRKLAATREYLRGGVPIPDRVIDLLEDLAAVNRWGEVTVMLETAIRMSGRLVPESAPGAAERMILVHPEQDGVQVREHIPVSTLKPKAQAIPPRRSAGTAGA